MKILSIIISLFILSSTSYALSGNKEIPGEFEIKELIIVTSIVKDIRDYLSTQTLKYGMGTNQSVVDYIAEEILIKKYNFIEKDFIVIITGDPVTIRPKSVIVSFRMVFDDYTFGFENFKVEEPVNEKDRDKNI